VGDKMFTTITTASAQDNLGGGTVGKRIFEAITTASAINQLGVGIVGGNLFTANTTASAQDQLGGGTVGKHLFGVNTTASAQEQLGLHEGLPIQVVNFQTGAVASGTTQIPNDDTPPQNTEGDQYMTLAITPTDASNTLFIDVVVVVSNSVIGTVVTVSLFQDSTANALATAQDTFAQDYTHTINFKHKMTAGTTSPTTFKVRIGGDQISTSTFNGKNAARKLGGTLASSITITEIKV
jgi:hypothetical protein